MMPRPMTLAKSSAPGYVLVLVRHIARRFLATFAGLSVSIAGSGGAMAHGFAHHEAAEHAAERAAEHSAANYGAGQTIGAADHDGDHSHPRLDPATFAGVAKGAVAIQSEAVTLPSLPSVVMFDSWLRPPNEAPPDEPGELPSRPRAPPAL